MEKHNTDDLFKKLLDNPPPMRPDMEALEDMNRRLEEVEEKRRKVLSLWLFPLLLLPFLLSSIFFYWKYDNAQTTINEIKSYSARQQVDTLTQRITIYEYDTIVQTIYQEEVIVLNQKNKGVVTAVNGLEDTNAFLPTFGSRTNFRVKQKFNTFDLSSLQPSQLGLLRDGKVISLSSINRILQENTWREETKFESSNMENLNWSITEPIAALSLLENRFGNKRPLPLSDHFFALNTKSNKKLHPLSYLVPIGFQAGLNWSPIGIGKLPGSNNNIKTIGISGDIRFSKNTSLQIGLDYLSVPLKAETAADLSQFPAIMPSDPADLFKEIYGDFKFLQVPLTFKYTFQADKKWQPTIGMGMIAILPIQQQLRYEFVSGGGGEYTLNQAVSSEAFYINNWRGTFGIGYNFYKNYTLYAEGYYQYQFGEITNPYFQLRYAGLNMSLRYKF